jgi:16S rRNA (uracil1498-N3)-methyltransferase
VTCEAFIRQAVFDQKLIAHCEEADKQSIKAIPPSDNTVMLIGPEGDFSTEEIRLALDNDFLPVSLGKTRLRAETAAIVASSLLIFR